MKHDWEYKKLGEMFQTSSGGTPSKNHNEYYEGGNIPWLRSGEVSQGDIYESEMFITQKGLDNSSAKIYPCNTVVIAMYGATVGQVGILRNEMSTNQAICGIFPSVSYKPEFLKFVLSAQKSNYLKVAVGGAQPNISQQIIKDTLIPNIPLPSQQSIVSELDSLSKIIADCKETLKDYDALEQSIFYDMFGDPVKNEKGWEVKKLGDVATCTIGLTYKPEDVSDSDEGIIVLRSGNIQQSVLDFEDIVRVISKVPEKKFVEDGDILMCTRNGSFRLVGKVAKITGLKERMSYGAFMTIIRSEYNTYLFEYFRTSAFRECLIQGQTSTVNQITVKMLNELSLPIPPLPLQQQFASKIEAIEKMKSETKKALQEAETLFNARMDYWFN